jgi:hypothetical protein
LPIRLGVTLIADVLPGGDFLDQGLLVRDTPAAAQKDRAILAPRHYRYRRMALADR